MFRYRVGRAVVYSTANFAIVTVLVSGPPILEVQQRDGKQGCGRSECVSPTAHAQAHQ